MRSVQTWRDLQDRCLWSGMQHARTSCFAIRGRCRSNAFHIAQAHHTLAIQKQRKLVSTGARSTFEHFTVLNLKQTCVRLFINVAPIGGFHINKQNPHFHQQATCPIFPASLADNIACYPRKLNARSNPSILQVPWCLHTSHTKHNEHLVLLCCWHVIQHDEDDITMISSG